MDTFEYVFPAIRGVQANREYYVSQCPLRLIPRLFEFDEADLPPEVRAQRVINRGRLPEIASYIVDNRDSYVFSALTASVDAEVNFDLIPGLTDSSRLGLLRIPMTARFVINDGQHRRGAIELALEADPTLGDETIAVVFFLDRGLDRSQQMFADLNRYAVRPSSSLGVLYDHRDPWSNLARAVVAESSLLRDLVEKEKTSLAPRSRKLFTLSAIRIATRALFAGRSGLSEDDSVREAVRFWDGISHAFPEWQLVHENKLAAGEVRTDFIHPYGTVLHALGRLGNSLSAENSNVDWVEVGRRLRELNWSKDNRAMWEGRVMTGGRVSKATNNVILTTNVLKQHLGVQLSPEERRVEDAFTYERSAQ